MEVRLIRCTPDPVAAIEDAAPEAAPVLICGSLFLCGEILAGDCIPEPSEWIQSTTSDERNSHQ